MSPVFRPHLLIVDSRQSSATAAASALESTIQSWPAPWQRSCVLLAEDDGPGFKGVPRCSGQGLASILHGSPVEWVGYMPLDQGLSTHRLSWPPLAAGGLPVLALWMPPQPLPQNTANVGAVAVSSWIASACLVRAALPRLVDCPRWSLLAIAHILEAQGYAFRWRVFAGNETSDKTRPVMPTASVLAVIPHYQCEPWLHRCLTSLMQQTRPPDQVVVVDDGSPRPPVDILHDFSTVTLLAACEHVGPYRLIQQVIEDTAYDYYCFQDADDWSSCDRLSRLLATATATNADLVGTQEIRVDASDGSITPVSYPLDVNAALQDQPGHPLLHPTSLVRRRLVVAVGGFATGLHFGGDTEFLLRAAWVGRIVNDDQATYFRQKRPDSLTTDSRTGLGSPARQALLRLLKQRANDNRAAFQHGTALNLAPLRRAPHIQLHHLTGPQLWR